MRTARRADRRLRETARQADTLALVGGNTGDPDLWIEHECLTIKSATAMRAGGRAMSRLRSQRNKGARALAERLRRHADEANAALERAAAALSSSGPSAEAPQHVTLVRTSPANAVRRKLGRSSAAAAVLVVAAVVGMMMIVPAWPPGADADQPARGGTLAGKDSVASSPLASPVPSTDDGEAAAGLPASVSLNVDFDAVRMGEGLGPEWVQTSGRADAVALAPFPNAVNRSARLRSIDVAGAEVCRPIALAPVRINRMVVEVLLSEPTTTAVVIARSASGPGELRVRLGASDTTLSVDGAGPLARGGGLPAGEWVRVEIVSDDGRTLWRLDGSSSGSVMEETIGVDALGGIDEVCLAVSADSTGAAHFDNLTVVIPEEG